MSKGTQKYARITDFEQRIIDDNAKKTGKPIRVVTDGTASPEEQEAIDRITNETIKKIKNLPVNIPVAKTLGDLTPEKRAQVLRDAESIISKEAGMFGVDDKEYGINPPSFQLDDGEGPTQTENPPPDDDHIEREQIPLTPQKIPIQPTVPPAPEPTKKSAVTEPVSHVCPNCSWDTQRIPGAVEDADKYAWLRATLSNKAFSKEFALFGGRVTVKFRVRTKADMELIQEQLIAEGNQGRLPSTPVNLAMIAYNDRLRKLGMAASLVTITGFKRDLPEIASKEAAMAYSDKINAANNVAAAADSSIFGSWTESLYASVFKQFLVFEDLCFRLAEASNSPDFWKETGAPV